MKNVLAIILLAIPMVLNAQEQEVKDNFETYKAAIVSGENEKVVSLVTQGSLDYYSELIDAALHADSAAIEELSIIDKINVLGMRVQVPKEKLLTMDGKDYMIFNMETNKAAAQSMQMISIGDVMVVDDSHAQGQMVANGEVIPMSMDFINEGGTWKIDMTSLIKMTEGQIESAVVQSGMNENEFIKMVMAQQLGKQVDDTIWQPIDQ